MIECKDCTLDVPKVHDDGLCHSCHVFATPDPILMVKTGDFPMTATIHGEIETVSCKTCGNKDFIVGKGSYLTIVKCKTCGWERTVHSG